MRTADNRVGTLIDLYGTWLSGLYADGEVKAIVRAVFHERMGWDAAQLEMHRASLLSESELLAVYEPLKRLRSGEPLQYILGRVHFHGLDLEVGPGVLIPRPETEELVEQILAQGVAPRVIVDVGTGSGCIALALKRAYPAARVIGIDVSADALSIAGRNAIRTGSEVEWMEADVLSEGSGFPAGADLIVSNPPYVPQAEAGSLSVHVRDHEPHVALFVGDDDPIRFYRMIADKAFKVLPEYGRLWFEGHHVHIREVAPLLQSMGFKDVVLHRDLSGQYRTLSAYR